MSDPRAVTRELSMIEFKRHAPSDSGGARRWWARAQNFSVEWIEAHQDVMRWRDRLTGQTFDCRAGDALPLHSILGDQPMAVLVAAPDLLS